MKLLSANFPTLGQLQKVFFLLAALSFLGSRLLPAQSIVYQDLADSTVVAVDTMPPLQPFVTAAKLEPYYEYLWIFSDGSFINGARDSVVRHVFALPAGSGTGDASAKAVATGLYSDDTGKPPPRAVPGDTIEVKERAAPPLPKSAVDSADFILLQRNHLNTVPGDTTVWIYSYRHNWPQFDAPLGGYLLFFYNGPIRLVEMEESGSKKSFESPSVSATATAQAEFVFHQNISPLTKSGNLTLEALNVPGGSTLEDYYTNLAVFRYDSLTFGEERHLFFEVANDTALLDKIPEKTKGEVDFMAVMTAEIPTGLDFNITDPGKLELINKTDLDGFVASSVNTTDIFLGNTLLDVQETSSTLSRAHDPNQLTTWACACPPGSEGEQQLIARIDFMNDGGAPTSDIYLTLYLPPGLNPNSVPATPLDVFPEPEGMTSLADNVKLIERTEDSIVWHLDGFRLETALAYGLGHPSTQGHLTFPILTDPGVQAADLPPMQVAIVFDDASPVYTLPASPILLSYADASEAGKMLQCEACVIPAGVDDGNGWPWWLILLILLILGLIIWFAFRNN